MFTAPDSPPASRADAPAAAWPCALCGGGSERLFAVHGIGIRQCGACGHQFAEVAAGAEHVDAVYGDEYFHGGGAGYDDYLSERRLLVNRGRWYARRLARYLPPGELLDVGAAAGFTLQGFLAAGWQGMGVEPNGGMAAYAREEFGLDVQQGSFERWQTDRRFDLVSLLQVVPHFADPRAAIEKAASLLKPGGGLLIETWNRASLTARVFGRGWHEYSPPSVLHWFTPAELDRLAAAVGLARVAGGRPAKWIDGGHAKSLLRHKAGSGLAGKLLLTAAALVPDRLPIPYPAEDLLWVLYRRPA